MKKCVVLGNGLVGQQFIRLLHNHPYFELTGIFSSENSAGQTLKEKWALHDFPVPESYKDMKISSLEVLNPEEFDVAFCGLPTEIAKDLESYLANKGIKVFSNASAHRYDNNVPILIPEINSDHLKIIETQKSFIENKGFIITNSNCTTSGVSLVLHEIMKFYSIKNIYISSYQALSGAGFEGLKTLPRDRVIPYIEGEETKLDIETRKILGKRSNKKILSNTSINNILANCARVPVVDGHLVSITIEFNEEPNCLELMNHFENLTNPFQDLPTAPKKQLILHKRKDRPQSILDNLAGEPERAVGMAVSVGNLRFNTNYIRTFVLVHNTIRGGAGGSILNAELSFYQGLL